MNRKWWKLIYMLPITFCTLYAGGYVAQFIRNYHIIRKLQYLMHFLQSHKTGSPIGSLCGIIQVPAPVCYFPVSVKSHTHEKEGQESKSCQT